MQARRRVYRSLASRSHQEPGLTGSRTTSARHDERPVAATRDEQHADAGAGSRAAPGAIRVCHDHPMTRLRRIRGAVGAVLIAGAVLAAVAHGTPAVRRDASIAASALDLHRVSWSQVTLPSVCGGSRPIRLHRPWWAMSRAEGTALVSPIPREWSQDSFYGRNSVEVDTGVIPAVYGDLARDGHDDAGLSFDCNNGGGTADGILLYGWVIFSGLDGKVSVVGVVTARVRPATATPVLITIAPRKLIAHEFFYGPSDPTCCASGRATTVWTYAHGWLHPGVTVITKRPTAGPA